MALSNGHRLVSSGSLFLWAFTLSTFSLFFAAFYFYFWFCYCSVELLLLLRCSRCCPVGKWNQRGISASERKVCTGRALLKVHFSSSSSSSSSSGCSCVEGKCMCALKILLKDAGEREVGKRRNYNGRNFDQKWRQRKKLPLADMALTCLLSCSLFW